jgi:hypothetical protein
LVLAVAVALLVLAQQVQQAYSQQLLLPVVDLVDRSMLMAVQVVLVVAVVQVTVAARELVEQVIHQALHHLKVLTVVMVVLQQVMPQPVVAVVVQAR